MPSFDVVSEVDMHEVHNAVDQANREIANRYDFKNSDARVEQSDERLTVYADDEYKVGQALDILRARLAKRKVDLDSLQLGDVQTTGGGKARQDIVVLSGIDQDLSKRIVKMVKGSKLKVQASIQGSQIRVTGKKRDDLQAVIAMLKAGKLGLPLQFVNFRD
ncbi:MAG: YajQ family cyclic di-GMP-binding protein [Gammaproteobacteria bacterium]|nr:YajQ family cyclic di-GMP-binding protein [Gammaproteobacteria bacterium]